MFKGEDRSEMGVSNDHPVGKPDSEGSGCSVQRDHVAKPVLFTFFPCICKGEDRGYVARDVPVLPHFHDILDGELSITGRDGMNPDVFFPWIPKAEGMPPGRLVLALSRSRNNLRQLLHPRFLQLWCQYAGY